MANEVEEVPIGEFLQGKLVYIAITLLLATIALFFFFQQSTTEKKKEEKSKEVKPEKKEKKQKEVTKKAPKQPKQEHPLKVVALKGHTQTLTSAVFSPSGKYVATTSEDRTLRIYPVKTFTEKTPNPTRINVPLDSATASAFSADGNHILIALANEREILAYKLSSIKDENGKTYKEVYRFPTGHQNPIKSIQIASNSKIILTSTEETVFSLWTIKGKKLEDINTNQLKLNMACISPDSRFLSVASWTGDVKIWEIKYNKESRDFEGTAKAMELKGHKSAVLCVDFSQNSGRVATTSKDGTWKLWKTDVRYQIGADPECILTVQAADTTHPFQLIAFSPDSKTIAVTSGNHLHFYGLDGKLIESVQTDHTTPIIAISWAPNSKTIVTGGDTAAYVWKNPNQPK